MKSVKEIPAAKAASKAAASQPAARGYQRWMPTVMVVIFAGWVLGGLRPAPSKSPFDIADFGKLPVVMNGRVQPMDSVARNTLLLMRSKSTLAVEPEGEMSDMAKMFKTKRVPAIDWLLGVMTHPDAAEKQKIFRVDHPEVKSLLKLSENEKHFSFEQMRPQFPELMKEAQRISGLEEDAVTTPFEKGVMRIATALTTFNRMKNSLQPEDAKDFGAEVSLFEKTLPDGLIAAQKSQAKEEFKEEDLALLSQFFKRFGLLEEAAAILVVPPADPANKDGWANIGQSLKESVRTGEVSPAVRAYSKMAAAYANDKPTEFNIALADYRNNYLKGRFDRELRKGRDEAFFNVFEPFIKAVSVYLVAFLFACAYWVTLTPWLRVAAVRLTVLALIIHTFGLGFRMYLEGRPPVTSLYSSALFVGWGCVWLCLILERIFKNCIPVLVATVAGFVTLIIAHNLALDGDTLKLLQAVLDTNIWLATHVTVITLGYSSMFVAGLLAIIYVLLGFFTRNLHADHRKNLTRMVYGITCFATLFSFVGTVLGGIWADQSWGRFWGWDPKENGALMIVIWCAVVLHARWGGMIRERGLMAMALFGNVVTSFSWWGVNMLGVGLHSYGFMDGAFKWLSAFIVSQLALIAITLLPPGFWRSLKADAKSRAEVKDAEALAAAQKLRPQT